MPWSWITMVAVAGSLLGWFCHPLLITTSSAAQDTAISTQNKPRIPVKSDATLAAEFKKEIYPLLEHYCYDCHMDGSDKGGLDLDTFSDLASMRKDPKTWEHILARIDYHLMPPPDEDQPDRATRDKLVSWINDAVFPVDPNKPHTGKRVVRRLNQVEYKNTIRDLLGVEIDANSILPPDDSGYGFDNIGSVLTISPAHIEKYLKAAETALNSVLVIGPMHAPIIRYRPTQFRGGGQKDAEGVYFFRNDRVGVHTEIKESGTYILHTTASAQQAGDELAKLEIQIDNKPVKTHSVKNEMGKPQKFTTKINLKRGKQKIGFAFTNDLYNPRAKDPRKRDRNLLVHQVWLEGPIGKTYQKPENHRRIFVPRAKGISDTEYARTVLSRFAPRAFRRPVEKSTINRYLGLVDQTQKSGESLEMALFAALQAMLVSPSFLYIAPPEVDDTKSSPTLLSEHALASRISYFLWSSMPDEKLLKLADEGKLRKNLDREITRMLADQRSREMVRHFSGQWLQLRDLSVVSPDRKRFRSFNPALARDMRTETEMLCDHILRGNLSLLEFLTADYSFINDRLAHHYVIVGVKGNHFRKVSLAGTPRRGLLTHGSILTLTSQPTRTSPVLRGKFILENILDITPPPPPPDLPELEDPEKHGERMSLREQLAEHRKKTACAGCHNLMDPIGLAYEHFDAIGRFRDSDHGQPIDSSGQLVTGEKVKDAESLRKILADGKKDEFIRCMTIKMMTYAYGRGLSRQDRHNIANILRKLKESGYHSHDLVRAIVHSTPFQYQ